MKLSLIIEARDRASRAVDAVRKSVAGLDRTAKQTASGGLAKTDRAVEAVRRSVVKLDRTTKQAATGGLAQTDRALVKTERSARLLDRAAQRVGRNIGLSIRAGAGQAVRDLGKLDRRLTLSREMMGKFAVSAAGALGGLARGAVIGGGAAAAAGLVGVVRTGMQFERFATQLTGLEGSSAAGKKSLDWVTKFASTTPYQIGEVMEAFIQLKAYGLDPTDGTLRTLGDTAAGMGKSLSQAVEMIADAQTGEFERLKEFGVKAKVAGDRVTFSFVRNGKQMTLVAKNTAADINATLKKVFNERFDGGMTRLAQTTEGKWSNLMDRMTITAKRVWEGGLSTSVNTQIDRFAGWVDRLEQSGKLKKWADETGKGIGDFVAEIGKADWQQIARDVSTVASAVGGLAKQLAYLSSETKSGPAGFLNDIGSALGAAGRGINGAGTFLSRNVLLGGDGTGRGAAPSPTPAPRRQPRGAPVSGGTQARPRQDKVAVDIRLSGPGAKDARVAGLKATPGTEATVNRGKTMGGAA